METTEAKIIQAQNLFVKDVTLTSNLNKHLQDKNHDAYSQEFSTAALNQGVILTADEVSTHFGFQKTTTIKSQIKETVKDEVKGAAKDEATGAAEDEISSQLGVDVGGFGDAAGGFFDTIKGWFGAKKKK